MKVAIFSISWVDRKCHCPSQLAIFLYSSTATSGPGLPHYRCFTITLRHTTLSRVPLYEWTTQSRDSTNQHTALTGDRYASAWRNSNPQSQRTRGRRPCPIPRESWGRPFRGLLIIIIYLSWSWATCCPAPVSRTQKSLERSTMNPSTSWRVDSYSVVIISITLNLLQDTQHNHKTVDYLLMWRLWRHVKKRKYCSRYAHTLMVSFTSRLS